MPWCAEFDGHTGDGQRASRSTGSTQQRQRLVPLRSRGGSFHAANNPVALESNPPVHASTPLGLLQQQGGLVNYGSLLNGLQEGANPDALGSCQPASLSCPDPLPYPWAGGESIEHGSNHHRQCQAHMLGTSQHGHEDSLGCSNHSCLPQPVQAQPQSLPVLPQQRVQGPEQLHFQASTAAEGPAAQQSPPIDPAVSTSAAVPSRPFAVKRCHRRSSSDGAGGEPFRIASSLCRRHTPSESSRRGGSRVPPSPPRMGQHPSGLLVATGSSGELWRPSCRGLVGWQRRTASASDGCKCVCVCVRVRCLKNK